jgi:hypothetical protein
VDGAGVFRPQPQQARTTSSFSGHPYIVRERPCSRQSTHWRHGGLAAYQWPGFACSSRHKAFIPCQDGTAPGQNPTLTVARGKAMRVMYVREGKSTTYHGCGYGTANLCLTAVMHTRIRRYECCRRREGATTGGEDSWRVGGASCSPALWARIGSCAVPCDTV